MYQKVKDVVLESGLWSNGRETSHGFVLSPSVYEVSQEKQGKFEDLGVALYDCMAGVGRIAAVSFSPQLGTSHTWGMIAKALRTGVPAVYHDIMLINPSSTPSICKVDFMESENGDLWIAEIDGHNKHGLGYSTLAKRVRQAVVPEACVFPGAATALAKEIKRRGKNQATLLYADQERFYLPEFEILQNELATLDVELTVVMESDFKGEISQLLVDFPFLYHKQGLNTLLADRYRNGEIDFLIPPKPFLGSKAVLALLRNDKGDQELEAILKSQIPLSSLELLRQHIPETYLVQKYDKNKNWMDLLDGRRFVLKESISPGMKGTVFTDDAHFEKIMERACGSYYRFILQEEVVNRPMDFQYFSENGDLGQANWFMRVTVHYAARRVADIVVTATRDKKAHGGKECIQLGSVIN